MGIFIAISIMAVWFIHLLYLLNNITISFSSPTMYFHLLVQTYLYTGLFITAHDAMHNTISGNKKLNRFIGSAATLLFAGLSFNRLLKNHRLHHKHPGSNNDPDFYSGSQNFILWWMVFMKRYTTIIQILIMAAAFNILKIWFDDSVLIMFWIVPAFLSTLQLFYFGTYVPHKYPHTKSMLPHNARSQGKNHLWAMLSCYFFGYHHEHHDSPQTPWWQLYKIK